MVKIVINNIYSKILGVLPAQTHEALDRALSYRLDNAWFMKKVREGKWDGVFRLYRKNYGQSFYTGLLSFVREILEAHGIEYQCVDRRVRPEINMPDLEFCPPSSYEERDYQEFTIDRSYKFTRGIMGVCTGGGKTMMVTKLLSRIQTYPFIFYVLTKDLMEQAHDVMSSCLNTPIGMIGDGRADFQKINVCTVQTAIRALKGGKFKISDYKFDDEDSWDEKEIESAEKIENIKRLIQAAKGLYFDEMHHAAASTCKEVLSASANAYWRYGGSATPYREGGDEIMLQAMFGAKIVDIRASYLIKRDYLVRPYIFFVPVETPCEFTSYPKIYKHCVVSNKDFNFHVARINRHINSIGLSSLILVQQYPQGDYLKAQLDDVEFVTGRMTSKQRTNSLDDLRSGKKLSMIATTLADEGLDVPTLDSALLAGGGASETRVQQRIGRTLRKDKEGRKTRSIVVIFEHNAKYLSKHAKKVRRLLKSEPEFKLINSKGLDFICDEINDVLGLPPVTGSLFD